MKTIFAQNLKQLLKQRRITLRTLSSSCGVSYQHLMNLLNGNRCMNADILYKIMVALKLSELEAVELTVDSNVQVKKGIKEIHYIPMARKLKSNLNVPDDGFYMTTCISEKNLNCKYSSDEDFKKAAILHLYNTFYKPMFFDIENEESNLTRYLEQTNNKVFLEIVDLIKDLKADQQLKIKNLVKLFLNSTK